VAGDLEGLIAHILLDLMLAQQIATSSGERHRQRRRGWPPVARPRRLRTLRSGEASDLTCDLLFKS
jgi:hypothetical protein